MSIHDQSNINLLINILESEFNRPTVRRPNFVKFFNDKLINYHERRFNYSNLQEMNKQMISDCFQFISSENEAIEKNTIILKPPPKQNPTHAFQTPTDPRVNRNKKKDEHNDSFDNYKKQYDTMLNSNKPKDIDFSDTIEDEPMKNIDSIINQTLEERANELAKITNTYNDAPPDWIKPTETNNTNDFNPNQSMKLIIEDEPDTLQPSSILKSTNSNPPKKVSFEINEGEQKTPTVQKLLNKLKLKSLSQTQQQSTQQQSTQQQFTQQQSTQTQSKYNEIDMENRIYSKIEANVEAKFEILNEKYDKLRIKYEELSMKYSEIIVPQQSTVSPNVELNK